MANDIFKQSGRLKTLLRILEDACKVEESICIDYDVLGIAKDFLLENDEIEKANCLDYLIKETKRPAFFENEYRFYFGSAQASSILLTSIFNRVEKITAKSFSALIYKVCLLWECATEILYVDQLSL